MRAIPNGVQKAIEENLRAFLDAIVKAKPTGAKGTYLKKIAVSSTMGPGVKIDLAEASAQPSASAA